jgi:hypothetical protein
MLQGIVQASDSSMILMTERKMHFQFRNPMEMLISSIVRQVGFASLEQFSNVFICRCRTVALNFSLYS